MRVREERFRRRLIGKLHRIGDNIFIPDLKCNGAILRFLKEFVEIQPHNYGKKVKRLPKIFVLTVALAAASGGPCIKVRFTLRTR